MKAQIIALAASIATAMGCTASGDKQVDEAAQQATSAEPIDAEIEHNLQLMANIGTEESWRASLAELRRTPGVVQRVVAIYDQYLQSGSAADPAFQTTVVANGTEQSDSLLLDGEQPSGVERRWLAVNLLGYLGREAITPLGKIVRAPLPDPLKGEHAFAIEYRIRLRAIAGLGNLAAQDELQRLYAAGGPLRRAAAGALTELGKPPAGFSIVEARTALGREQVDTSDINPDRRPPSNFAKPPQVLSTSDTGAR